MAWLLHLQYGLCLKNEQLFFKWNLTTRQIIWKSCSSSIKASSRFHPFCSAGYPQYNCVCLFLDSLTYLITYLQDEVVRLSDPCRVWEHEVVSSFIPDGLSPTEGCLNTEQCRGQKPGCNQNRWRILTWNDLSLDEYDFTWYNCKEFLPSILYSFVCFWPLKSFQVATSHANTPEI